MEEARLIILLLDDSEDDTFFLKRALERNCGVGIHWHATKLVEARCYLEGLGIFGDRSKYPYPDVVITDLGGECRGIELLDWIQQCDLPHPKVVVWSGSDYPDDIKASYEHTADLFQRKAVDTQAMERFFSFIRLAAKEGQSG